jgi:hypothetical protein
MNSRGFSKIEILITDDGVNVETKWNEKRNLNWCIYNWWIAGLLFCFDSLNNHVKYVVIKFSVVFLHFSEK